MKCISTVESPLSSLFSKNHYLQIPMNDIRRMDVFQTTHKLVHEELNVLFCERLAGVYDAMQVCVHLLGHHVDVEEVQRGGGRQVRELDDVGMLEVAQEPDLPGDAFRVRGIFEDVWAFFDGHLLPESEVEG